MKFNFRNFFAFGLLFSIAFMIVSAFFIFISPSETSSSVGTPFMGLTTNAWKTQFVFSFFLILFFSVLFLLKINWKTISEFINSEFQNKIWNSTELWVSLVLVFIIVALSGSDINILKKIAGTYSSNELVESVISEEITSIDNNNNNVNNSSLLDLRTISLADLTLDQIAQNYQNMTKENVLYKLTDDNLKCPKDAITVGDIAITNELPVNEIIRIIGYGELLSAYVKNGKPIKYRNIQDAVVETGIPALHLFKILESSGIANSGSLDQTFSNMAISNDQSPVEIYSILKSNGEKPLPKKNNSKALKDFSKAAASMTIRELSSVIKQQQPEANVTSEIITKRLTDNNINIKGSNITISQIAKANSVEINDIIRIISFGSKQDPDEKSGTRKLDGPPNLKAKGKDNTKALEFIQTPLTGLAEKYNMSIDKMIDALSINGISSSEDETIEEIAKNNNQKPGPIIKILREERLKQQKN